jgi:hypothetical protein
MTIWFEICIHQFECGAHEVYEVEDPIKYEIKGANHGIEPNFLK